MSESRSRITDYRSRPSSEQLVDLHIYVVPPDIWREKHNDVLNTDVNETISAGFVRVHPENKVFSLRDDIEQQLGVDVLPREYVFMKCVGRSLTRVKAKQEYQLKVKNFLPPLAYLPEVYLLEITPDIRAHFGMSSGEGSSRSQTRTSVRAGDSPRHQPTNRGRYPDDNPDETTDRYNSRDRLNFENEKIRNNTNHPEKGRRGNKGYENRAHTTNTNEDSGIAEYTPDDAYKENNYDDKNSRRQKELDEMQRRDDDLRRKRKEEQARREQEDRRRREAEREELRRRLADDMGEDDLSEMDRQQLLLDEEDRRQADEERWQEENERRRRAATEDEDRRRRDEEEEEEYQRRREAAAAEEEQEAKRKQQEENDLKRIEEERRRLQNHELNKHENDDQTDEELARFPSPPPLRLSSPDKEDTEEDKKRKRREKDKLQSELEKAREERRNVEKQREELVKRAKQLQTKTQNRRNHARDLWKKRYFEEKKKTSPLEDQTNRLRHELDQIHRKLMTTLEGPKDARGVKLSDNKPSEKNNYKIQATKLQHEIEDMRRKVENSKMKLTAEMKLRNQAETELRALRAELTQKKINLTLTRSQQLATLANTQDLAYMSPRAMATPRS